MGSIYCLYATDDGAPRHIGHITDSADQCRRRHVAAALAMDGSPVSRWIREKWESGHELQIYVLQDDVPELELTFYEDYWTNQFAGLLRSEGALLGSAEDTQIGRQIREYLRSGLPGAS
jgi:hypothetical protein